MRVLKFEDLLNVLSTTEYKTTIVLSALLKASDKTIRNRIKELNDELKNHGAHIKSKQKFGYILVIDDEEKYNQFKYRDNTGRMPVTSDERVQFILAFLLNQTEYVKIDHLCEFLFVSRNTLIADIKKAEGIFDHYHLSLERKSYYGIKLTGDEFSKRACIIDCFVKKNMLLDHDAESMKRMKKVGQILREMTEEQALEIAEVEFENIVKYITISISRVKHGFHLHLSKKDIRIGINDIFFRIANRIIKKIEDEFSLCYEKEETEYLAIQLSVKMEVDGIQPNTVISADIDQTVQQILDYIYETMKLDFRGNLELRIAMGQHVASLDIRIRYHIPFTNPQKEEMKSMYPLAYTLSNAACAVLNARYHVELDEEEICYLALHFALILEKREKVIQKKNIVMVCVSGNETSRLLAYRYRKIFGEYIGKIYESTILKLKQFDFRKNQIDYVFTTVPLNFEVPVQVIQTNLFPTRDEIERYRGILEQSDRSFLYKYYKSELFIPCLPAETREEVIQKMCGHVNRYYPLPEKFYDSVMKRENACHTDFGNLTALPHPAESITTFDFVCVAILEKPIWWECNDVQVVFMVALSADVDDNIQEFFEATMNLLVDPKGISQLINEPDFDKLMSLFSPSR
ncbi:MAG: transcription antiterminator [Lachnospiraceae bacterium]|jgi:lichenan operon transcriptional antiterminator|nr:transcription antiterminator [Lachnospiraceae bacterium]